MATEIKIKFPLRVLGNLILLMLVFGLLPITQFAVAPPSWTIDGDVVYINDENLYLATYPHTTEGGYVYVNLTSKQYGGLVDFVFGVDGSIAKPRTFDVYNPRDVWEQYSYVIPDRFFDNQYFKYNLTADVITPPNAYNGILYLWSMVGYNVDLEPFLLDDWELVNTYPFVVAYLDTRTVYWQEEVHYDWTRVNNDNFEKIHYNYAGMNTWYYSQFNIQEDVEYHVRILIDIAPRIGSGRSKYTVGIKPAGESISEAIGNSHLYILDPWLEWNWDQRVKLTIDSGDVDAELTDFPLVVHLSNSTAGISDRNVSFIFDEIEDNYKKIAITTSDGETQCYVMVESWDATAGEAYLRVKVPTIASGADTELYLYFDNDHPDNTGYVGLPADAVVHNVWDSDYFFASPMKDDPDNAHVRDASVNDNTGHKIGASTPAATAVGMIDGAQDYDGTTDQIDIDDHASLDVTRLTINFWLNIDNFGSGDTPIVRQTAAGGGSNVFYIQQSFEDPHYHLKGGIFAGSLVTVTDVSTELSEDTWYLVGMVYDGVDITLFLNGQAIADVAQTGNMAASDEPILIGAHWVASLETDGLMDDVLISGVARTDAWMEASYESGRDHIITFGDEEAFVQVTVTESTTTTDSTETSTTTTLCITSICSSTSTTETTDTSVISSTSTTETTDTSVISSTSTTETTDTTITTTETTETETSISSTTTCTSFTDTSISSTTTCTSVTDTSISSTSTTTSLTDTSISSTTTCTSVVETSISTTETTETSIETSISTTETTETTITTTDTTETDTETSISTTDTTETSVATQTTTTAINIVEYDGCVLDEFEDDALVAWYNNTHRHGGIVDVVEDLIDDQPDVIDTETGTLDSGNLASVLTDDADYYSVSEVVGAPGFDIRFNFTGLTDTYTNIHIDTWLWYDGGAGHDVYLQVWNYTSGAWVTCGTITEGVAFAWFNFTHVGVGADVISGDVLMARIYHTSAGNINHDIYIDYIEINLDACPCGEVYSENMLNDLNVTSIVNFRYSITIPVFAGAFARVQFSQDNSTWVDSGGISQWEEMVTGDNSILLTNLDWSGSFFYRVWMHKDLNGTSPELDLVQVCYSTTVSGGGSWNVLVIPTALLIAFVIAVILNRRKR